MGAPATARWGARAELLAGGRHSTSSRKDRTRSRRGEMAPEWPAAVPDMGKRAQWRRAIMSKLPMAVPAGAKAALGAAEVGIPALTSRSINNMEAAPPNKTAIHKRITTLAGRSGMRTTTRPAASTRAKATPAGAARQTAGAATATGTTIRGTPTTTALRTRRLAWQAPNTRQRRNENQASHPITRPGTLATTTMITTMRCMPAGPWSMRRIIISSRDTAIVASAAGSKDTSPPQAPATPAQVQQDRMASMKAPKVIIMVTTIITSSMQRWAVAPAT